MFYINRRFTKNSVGKCIFNFTPRKVINNNKIQKKLSQLIIIGQR